MKAMMKPLPAALAALVISAAAFAPVAHADEGLSAAAGVATSYYWRGLQVSDGAQVWGELTYTLPSGFYGDLWASSQGFGTGPEYDLTVGWSGQVGELGINVGAVTYVYSRDNSQAGPFDDNDPGDFSDAFVKLSYGGAFGGLYYNIAQAQEQAWVYGGYTLGKFTASVGYQQFKDSTQIGTLDDKWDYTYVDLTFAATEHLSITVSSVVDHNGEGRLPFDPHSVPANLDTNRPKVMASYSLPISF